MTVTEFIFAGHVAIYISQQLALHDMMVVTEFRFLDSLPVIVRNILQHLSLTAGGDKRVVYWLSIVTCQKSCHCVIVVTQVHLTFASYYKVRCHKM